MNEERAVWEPTAPGRDAGWWVRSAAYWLVAASASPLLSDGATPGWLGQVLGVVVVAALAGAIWLRDRWPWALALLAVALGLAWADAVVALGVVAVVSRVRTSLGLAYGTLAAGVLLAPVPRVVPSALTLTQGAGGEGQPIEGALRAVLLVVGFVVLPGLIGAIRRANRRAADQRRAFEARQRDLAAAQATVEERHRIAQEMHDVLGHKLSLITLQAGGLAVNAGAGEAEVAQQAELIRGTARQALDDLRAVLGVLGSPADAWHPQPGLAETRDLLAHNQASGVRLVVEDELGEATLPPRVAAAVNRIVTEALTNASQHAPGAAVTTRLGWADGGHGVRVEVVNRPSAQRGAGPGTGRGLPGLRERAHAGGGWLESGPTDEGGFRVVAELPLARHEGSRP